MGDLVVNFDTVYEQTMARFKFTKIPLTGVLFVTVPKILL
jgi:hypothetical protein